MKRSLQFVAFVAGLACVAGCSSTRINSNPKNLYFSKADTLIIAGMRNARPSFHDAAQQEFERAFAVCDISKLVTGYQWQDLLIRKAARQTLDLHDAGSLRLLNELGITGYVIEGEIISLNNNNSLVNYIPHDPTRAAQPDPFVTFRFRIYHVRSKAVVLKADVKVKSNSVIVGENVDTDIGVNRGIDENQPTHELRKSLKKLVKMCNCK